jgi:biotin operon repressor/anti-sigma regulatory factor (Ser/Thr protein kinase)
LTKAATAVDVKARILQTLKARGALSGAQIAGALGLSRQAAHRHLVRLMDQALLSRTGRTRGVLYRLPDSRGPLPETTQFRRKYRIDGLMEDAALAEVNLRLPLKKSLSGAAYRIFAYAFTEMLNNAIEHSHSPTCSVDVELAPREVRVVIRDLGVGVFASVAERYRLAEEEKAIGELLKGKATSMPERHAGEGIFFTSKACDRFALRSHRIELVVDARKKDTFVNVRSFLRGTEVSLTVSRSARRKLQDVFADFAPEDFDFRFERSLVTVRFYSGEYVSRSEARRLLARLDQFREVILDFSRVRSIGQGFADEIFRVFAASHPGVVLRRVNVAPALEAVIRHVVDNTGPASLTTG